MCKNSLTVFEKLRASKANMQKHLLYEQGRNIAEKKKTQHYLNTSNSNILIYALLMNT